MSSPSWVWGAAIAEVEFGALIIALRYAIISPPILHSQLNVMFIPVDRNFNYFIRNQLTKLGNLVLFKRVVKSCLDGLWGSWAPSSTMLPFIAT